jgi:outer membrane cobalamin receptor
MCHRFAPVVGVLALTAAPLLADAAGTLTGSVRASDGTPLPQLVLTLEGPGGSRSVVTGPEGRFQASGLPAGDYRIVLAAPGFVLGPEPEAHVGDAPSHVELTLAPAPVRERVLVAATRGDALLSTLGVSASVVDREQLAARQPTSVLQLLQELPGVSTTRLGGPGSQASAFVRGGESRFARILVDGVPVNEPGGAFDFGGLVPLELERVEVVRGAASSLYGTDALAGVVQLVTRSAAAPETRGASLQADAGSFGWRRGHAATSGRSGRFDWNAGLLRLTTDNDGPNARFEQTAAAAAFGARVSRATTLRLVLRGADGETGTPGQTLFGPPDLEESIERTDLLLGAQLRHVRDSAAHELRLGLSRSDQLTRDPGDSGSFVARLGDRVAPFPSFDFVNPDGFQNDTRRLTLGYQLERQVGGRHLLGAGAELERETGKLGSRPSELLGPERSNVGAFVQDRIAAGERLFLTLGARLERNDSFGTRVVPRAAAAYRLRSGRDGTTLRASAGEGIKEPSFLESFGVADFARGNPDLRAEKSRTFDVGVEQRALDGRLRLEAALFHHEYRDQIAFTVLSLSPFRGSYENLGRTRGRGLELTLEAAPAAGTSFEAHYTWLDGEILESASGSGVNAPGQPLLRRPAHQATLSARTTLDRVTLGATLLLVGKRPDSDFAGLGLTQNAGHARLDARARVRLGRGVEALVAAENLLDREYQEALGYPALRRALRAGLRYELGRR